MKITICASAAFYPEMEKVQKLLELKNYEVTLPPSQITDNDGNIISVEEYYTLRKTQTDPKSWIWKRKGEIMHSHFEKIQWADTILVLNYDKNSVVNYIGSNTLIEMGIAFYLKKTIYLLNPIPEVSAKEEILAMNPVVLHGDISKI